MAWYQQVTSELFEHVEFTTAESKPSCGTHSCRVSACVCVRVCCACMLVLCAVLSRPYSAHAVDNIVALSCTVSLHNQLVMYSQSAQYLYKDIVYDTVYDGLVAGKQEAAMGSKMFCGKQFRSDVKLGRRQA